MPARPFLISIVLAILAMPAGFLGWLSDRTENSEAEIAQVEPCLTQLVTHVQERVESLKTTKKRFLLNPAQRATLEECLQPLTPRNQSIGRSKFTARTGVLVEEWDGMYAAGSNPWVEKDWAEKEWSVSLAEASGIALVSAAGTFTVAMILMLLLRWSWGFVLERIRELSKAVRGQ